MRNKVILISALGIIVLIAVFLYSSRKAENKVSGEKYFAFLGNSQLMSSLRILNQKQVEFFVAKGTYKEKTATFFIDAEQIDKAAQRRERVEGSNLIVELMPEWVVGAQYKLRFRPNSAPTSIFSGCAGKTEECYFEDIRYLIRITLNETKPQLIASNQITIDRKSFEIMEAEPKKMPTSRGCNPTSYQLIKYNGDWYAFRTSDLCID